MEPKWNTNGTQMEHEWLADVLLSGLLSLYFEFCFGRGQLLAHSGILWFSTVVGRCRTSGIHHDAHRGQHVRHELDSAEKWKSFLRDIGVDGYFCRIYGWGCSGGVLIMTATPTLPRGAYRLRPVFGLSSFVGLQFYGALTHMQY